VLMTALALKYDLLFLERLRSDTPRQESK